MGLIKHEQEVHCAIPPERLFKAFVLDGDNLLPKVVPAAFSSIKVVEGDGKAGTVKLITFGEGSAYKTSKHVIDELDEENKVFSYTVLEGDALLGLEKVKSTVKIHAHGSGSVIKSTSEYYVTGTHEITEDKIKEGKEKAKALFKAVEAHLVAHPHEYC